LSFRYDLPNFLADHCRNGIAPAIQLFGEFHQGFRPKLPILRPRAAIECLARGSYRGLCFQAAAV
jgi:hypothetical protein